MLKNAHFLEKSCKNRFSIGGSAPEPTLPPAAGGSAPRPPRYYSSLLLQLFAIRFLAINVFYYNKKEQKNCSRGSAFASSEVFPPIFHFSLLTGDARMFLAPGRK